MHDLGARLFRKMSTRPLDGIGQDGCRGHEVAPAPKTPPAAGLGCRPQTTRPARTTPCIQSASARTRAVNGPGERGMVREPAPRLVVRRHPRRTVVLRCAPFPEQAVALGTTTDVGQACWRAGGGWGDGDFWGGSWSRASVGSARFCDRVPAEAELSRRPGWRHPDQSMSRVGMRASVAEWRRRRTSSSAAS